MAEAGTGSGGALAIPANVDLDKSRDNTVSVRLTGLSAVDGRGFSLGYGAPTPATKAGLTDVYTVSALAESAGTSPMTISSALVVSIPNIVVNAGTLALASSGDHLYACVWPTLTPISSTAPSVLVDLGEIF